MEAQFFGKVLIQHIPVAVGAAHAGRHDGVAPVVVAEGGQGPVKAK